MLVECAAGLLAGLVAWYVIPDSQGIGADALVGTISAGTGAFLFDLFGHRVPFDAYSAGGILVAVISAFAVLLAVRAAAGRRSVGP